jgi:transposase InsO family protein
MLLHRSAKTTPELRLSIVHRVQEGEPVQEVARAIGVSRTTAYKWLRRFREEGPSGLLDRSSRPPGGTHWTRPAQVARIGQLRHLRLLMRDIARRVKLALSTVAAVLKRLGLNRLPPLEEPTPSPRYERDRPGDLLHVDVKKLGRFREIGHRIHGRKGHRSRGMGWEYVHVCVDDHTRLAYVEVLPDERKETAAGFLERAVEWYRSLDIEPREVLSDNGSAYCSRLWRRTCARLGLRARRTRPYTPRTNGKAERFIQTLIRSWAYGQPYSTSGYRLQALTHWLRRYNERRPHHGIGGLTPLQRLRQACQ